MIPRVDVEAGIVPTLPAAATYWMPTGELPAEGIGAFRGVWRIDGVTPQRAADVVAREREAVEDLDALSPDAEAFDRLAHRREEREFDGLEVGVAGLTYALAALGCVPAASCRGHVGDGAWSYKPIVFAAIDRPHADWLLPRVRLAKCGFGVGAGRENLLAIQAASIVDMMRLAVVVLREAAVIPPPAPV